MFLVRMEQKVHSILRKGLKNVREDERDLAMRLLMVIGLKHYDLLYSSQEIQMPVLEYLCGKSNVSALLIGGRFLITCCCRQIRCGPKFAKSRIETARTSSRSGQFCKN